MIPGLEHAEFARYGVMHRNTSCAPRSCSTDASRARGLLPRAPSYSGPAGNGGLLRGHHVGSLRSPVRLCRPVGDNHAADASRYGVRGVARIRHRPEHMRLSADACQFRHHGAFCRAYTQQAAALCRLCSARERALCAYLNDLREAGVL
ncbi:MAG: hypothetical protein ACLTQI_00375 [Slackia sp.]